MAVETPLSYDELITKLRQTLGRMMAFPNFSVDLRTLAEINVSYSSSGEDLWLRQFMKPHLRSGQSGFYVDIGCNQATITSNTFLFNCYGWRGICVDANPQFALEYAEIRPRDVFVHAAISDSKEPLYFAEHKGEWGHKIARVAASPKDFTAEYKDPVNVPVVTMAQLFKAHVPLGVQIDFMSIDVEGGELPALRSNDWATYRPRVILTEITVEEFDPLASLAFPTIRYLHELGYKYQGYSSNNVLLTGPNF